jgi:hypothetical protein
MKLKTAKQARAEAQRILALRIADQNRLVEENRKRDAQAPARRVSARCNGIRTSVTGI